mgnify:CR=1 FL=1
MTKDKYLDNEAAEAQKVGLWDMYFLVASGSSIHRDDDGVLHLILP